MGPESVYFWDTNQPNQQPSLKFTTGDVPRSSKFSATAYLRKNDYAQDEIIVFGGFIEYSHYSNEVHILNVDTLVWHKIPSNSIKIPQARVLSKMFVVDPDTILIYGGHAGLQVHDIWRFTVSTGIWQNLSPHICFGLANCVVTLRAWWLIVGNI